MLLRSLHLTLRFILPLALVLALFAYALVPLVNNMTTGWFVRDLDSRAQLLAGALRDPLRDYLTQPSTQSRQKIASLLEHTVEQDSRLYALAFCNVQGELRYRTTAYPMLLGCPNASTADKSLQQSVVNLGENALHVTQQSLGKNGGPQGTLMLVQDMGFIDDRVAEVRRYIISLFILLALVISLMTAFIAHWSWQGWIRAVRDLLRRDTPPHLQANAPPEIRPLVSDLRALLREIGGGKRQQDHSPQAWTPEKLRSLLHDELAGDQVLVVSNREPYIHECTDKGIQVRRPASGLVTAVEPVMRACSGTWIAHGAGSADRETVDQDDRVGVPPAAPAYTLRRVWLTEEEEQGYYYGFANEGLWPLCHIAHVRPVFRTIDWEQYVIVNQRFADAVVAEARTEDPVVLVQDYHFALVPRMVRKALPKATILTFWHIPWSNPESFGICPWREEILEGLLGSTLIGFHTPFHRKNFIETVDRYLETRIEHEASTISYGGELTQIEAYPISIAWPTEPPAQSVAENQRMVRADLGLPREQWLAVGVDRLDYTKGILERLTAVERMLELHPEMVGRFTMLQIAAPSRSALDEYQNFESRVRALAARINQRFAGDDMAPPIILKIEHHNSEQVTQLYRAANVCAVTSLHDGMNLVAKEFIAARDDERGVLVLSQFTGAARELHEALIVNPYHIEQCAEALYQAIVMPEAEQRDRMRSMRTLVHDNNVYRWAGHMLLDAARLRRREKITARIHLHSRKSLR